MKTVGIYCAWDESFDRLTYRMSLSTPGLRQNQYKSIRYVTPDEPHEYALVFNASEKPVKCLPQNTYVILFEPVEILGEDNPWLNPEKHPQSGANIFSFCGGTQYPTAYGLHLVQSSIAPDGVLPSNKEKLCSMICSDKTQTPYHRKRREVLEVLLDTDLPIDFYGRNMRSSVDPRVKGSLEHYLKNAALLPYRYVIDFENSHRDVITDKFIDPILNASIPITNSTAAHIFPPGSYRCVDFADSVIQIVLTISKILERDMFIDEQTLKARELLTTGPMNISEWLYRKIHP